MTDNVVMVNVEQEDLYKFFLFAEERMEEYLFAGAMISPADVHKHLDVMYALKEAALRIQPGEVVQPYQGKHAKKGIAINYDDHVYLPTEATC